MKENIVIVINNKTSLARSATLGDTSWARLTIELLNICDSLMFARLY